MCSYRLNGGYRRSVASFPSAWLATELWSVYPFTSLPLGTKICDIGGGVGAVSMALSRRCPQLHITLQDLPETIEEAKKVNST
jgi:2-polyprenyl-3-methyl-5-hydroxy-6-metoxy-1,4-benzoquinol methylase